MPGFYSEKSPTILTLPGIDGNAEDHWQSIWERDLANCRRVDVELQEKPIRNNWVNNLNFAIRNAEGPVILVAHGLACHAVAWWAALERPAYGDPVLGALLVAPPEIDYQPLDERHAAFAPSPVGILPFRSILVGSQNDPYMSIARARRLASLWGSEFIDAGTAGHINSASDLGEWAFGKSLLSKLAKQPIEKSQDRLTPDEAYLMTSYWSISGSYPI